MRIERITVAEMRRESVGLLVEHYEELCQSQDVFKLAPDWAKYTFMESTGVLLALGLWHEEDLVGYVVFFISRHPHYRNQLTASNDVLFLAKAHRNGFAGIRLIKEAERRLTAMGVVKVFWRVKFETLLGPILERMGYAKEEYTVAKTLGE
jgi:hypothetical protein